MSNINKEKFEDYFELIKNSMQKFECDFKHENNEFSIHSSKKDFIDIIHFIKDYPTTNFDILVDICAVDYPKNKKRFEIVYQFLSTSQKLRMKLKLKIFDKESVPSICSIFPNSNWYEREIWDLFGISFVKSRIRCFIRFHNFLFVVFGIMKLNAKIFYCCSSLSQFCN